MDKAAQQIGDRSAADAIRTLGELPPSLTDLSAPVGLTDAAVVGFGWWLRVLRTAEGILLMHDAGLSHEASPLLRTVLHHTVAIEWLRQNSEEVLEALHYEHALRRQTVGQKATERNWDLDGVKLGPPPRGDKPEGLKYLSQFEKLCDRVGAPDVYMAYKVESTYAHASGLSADTYVELDDSDRLELRVPAKADGADLKATAILAAIATNTLGESINDVRLTRAAGAVGEQFSVAVTLVP